MADESFDRLMEFFQLGAEEKMSRFAEVLKDTVTFFQSFRKVMEEGSSEEKTDMLRKAMELQKVMQSETEGMCESIGISEEELKQFATNAGNFSQEQWESMQETRGELDKEVDAISNVVKFPGSSSSDEKKPQPTKPKKPKSSRDGWIKS